MLQISKRFIGGLHRNPRAWFRNGNRRFDWQADFTNGVSISGKNRSPRAEVQACLARGHWRQQW